jgi:hypothetical protein
VRAQKITGPAILKEIQPGHYVKLILALFFKELTEQKIQAIHFLQNILKTVLSITFQDK